MAINCISPSSIMWLPVAFLLVASGPGACASNANNMQIGPIRILVPRTNPSRVLLAFRLKKSHLRVCPNRMRISSEPATEYPPTYSPRSIIKRNLLLHLHGHFVILAHVGVVNYLACMSQRGRVISFCFGEEEPQRFSLDGHQAPLCSSAPVGRCRRLRMGKQEKQHLLISSP